VDSYQRLTYRYPHDAPRTVHLAGLQLTDSAAEYLQTHGVSISELVAAYGGPLANELVWERNSLRRAGLILAAEYCAVMISFLITIALAIDDVVGSQRPSIPGIHALVPRPPGKSNTRAVPRAFVSYSHKDIRHLLEFKRMLAPAIRSGAICLWDDSRILTGANWRRVMPTDTAHLPIGSKYVLQGRVVTMGPQGVVARGAIYIESNEIKAVQRTVDPPPEGFEAAPRINVGGTMYPGLIELHNHLSYNAMPLWDVPLKYTNSGQWKNHDDYRRLITKPAQVLGRTAGVVEAVVRFVECKCLLGGVTTTQGITLANASGIQSIYRGLIRNVEQPDDPQLPRAGTRIANPDTGKAREYLETLGRHTCYLQHLSEGVDATAQTWFHRLKDR
jgi:hypothetical protein